MIRKLPPELIREIAAGEVIQSPVDVVKELLDNALDAGGGRLELHITSGGITHIELKDNGAGIAKDELALAAEAHATSKLEDLKDIRTLGFRGEGLYAIRNAAHLEMRSRPKDQLGGAVLISEGDSLKVFEQPLPAGTTVIVSQLFKKLPARFTSLDSPASENKKILNLLSRYLFHHPELYLKFLSDGSEKWTFSGGKTLEAVKFFWGTVTANRLLELDYQSEDSKYRLKGAISRPELSRSKRDRLLLAVNGRPVEWTDELLEVIVKAYQELLPSGHYPVGVLNLSLPFDEVLVNTAP
ncbi:MAG: DNA mismatch repair endonuclease MutL, partial [Deinococcales bacterium]